MVEIFDSPNLQVEVAVMSGLVGSLKMQKHKILIIQLRQCRLYLSLIVCVGKTRGPRGHLYHVETGIVADTPDEVDSRNDTTRVHLGIQLLESLHRRTVAPLHGQMELAGS